MKTTTDEAREIRQTLKKDHGITSRQVSVRADYFSMGSAIRVTIKDPAVSMAVVEPIAKQAERISRCEITHEILSGGNTYVTIDYSPEAAEARGLPYLPAVREAIALLDNLDEDDARSRIVPIAGTDGIGVAYANGYKGCGYRLWTREGAATHINTPECAARIVADLVEKA